MALDTAFMIAQELLRLDPFLLLGLVFAFAFIAYKVFALLFRILLTGLAFAAFPFIASALGLGIPVTPQTILWSAITGILIYFVYMGIKFATKIINLVFYPFSRGEKRKVKTVYVKEVEKKKKDNKK
jgi:hypothetical protein